MNKLSSIIDVSTSDPQDARRRRLLNIMLLASAASTFLILVVLVVAAPTGLAGEKGEVRALSSSIVLALLGIGFAYVLNRYVSGKVASALFLLLLIVIAAFSDEPVQIVDGRGLLVFAVPILAASVLLSPWTSFVAAGLSSLVIVTIGRVVVGHAIPNLPAIASFFVLAVVSYLSARSLARPGESTCGQRGAA